MLALAPHITFGDYRLGSRVARGGMGEVWRATKTGPDGWAKQVALKLVRAADDEERFAAMFLREAKIAAQLDHPNIVPVFSYGRHQDVLWIEQELVDGMDLSRLIRAHGRLPIPVALYVLSEILEGLRYAHERRDASGLELKIVHRDIKPANVLVSRDGHVKLSDFGIAKVTAEGGMTKSSVKGTAGYIAPEVLEGVPASAQADLFGMGLILWEVLTGQRLFDGETEAMRLRKTLQCEVPDPAAAGADVSPALLSLLKQLLAREPEDRFLSAGAARQAVLSTPEGRSASSIDLRRIMDTAAPPVVTDAPAPAHTPAPETFSSPLSSGSNNFVGKLNRVSSSRKLLFVMAVAAVFALSGALVVWFVPRAETVAVLPVDAGPDTRVPVVVDAAPKRAPVATASIDAARARPQKTSQLRIKVSPSDATVTVNGRPVSGRSPFVVKGLPRGLPVQVHVERKRYRDHDAVWVAGKARGKLRIKLERARASDAKTPAAVDKTGRDKKGGELNEGVMQPPR